MIKINRYVSRTVLAVLVLGFLSTSGVLAAGQEPRFKPIAEEMIAAGGISWSPKVNYYRLVLTIARPDGTVFSKTFDSGSTPYVGLSGIFGEGAYDGAYTYELRLVPRVEGRVRGGNQDTIVARTQSRGYLPRKALTQSGGFTVKDGMIVTDSMTEPEFGGTGSVISTSTADNGISRINAQTFNTDLIVQGSACVGVDCTSSESFGFDTIRLKENNLRIKFQDTSSSASFPSNDWQLTANESSNGGKNKFSIDDISGGRTPFTVEASAPNNSLYVEDGGNVGFGTATPVVDLHAVSGNTPTLRLEQDGSSGFTAQTWDLAGNEANFFIRDVSHSSNLAFRIKPGSGNDDALYIHSDGDIGLGTDSPTASLHVEQKSDTDGIYLKSDTNTDAVLKIEKDGLTIGKITAGNAAVQVGSFSDDKVHFVTGASPTSKRMTINNTNGYIGVDVTNPTTHPLEFSSALAGGAHLTTGGAWTNGSSRELKENIRDLKADEALDTLKDLNPVRFYYKVDREDEYVGFIAEDVPEMVASKYRKGISPMDVVAVLTKVVKEQQKAISELKEKVSELEKKQ